MFGTRPIGSAPLSSIGAITYPVSITDTLSVSDTFSINIAYVETISDSLTLTQTISDTLNLSLSDSLTLTSTINDDLELTISHEIVLSELLVPVTYYTNTDNPSVSLTSTLLLNPETLNLDLTDIVILSDTYAHEVITSVSDTLTLTQDLQNSEFVIDQSLSLTDTYTSLIDYAITLTASVTLDEVLDVSGDYSDTVTDTITFFTSFEDYLLSDELLLSDAYIYSSIETEFITQSLTLTQTLDYVRAYNLSISDSFTLVDDLDLRKTITQVLEDEIDLRQSLLYVTIFDLALCDVLAPTHNYGNQIDIVWSDTVVLTEPANDLIDQTLVLVQTLDTNMDNEDCAHPGGYSPEKEFSSELVLTQTYAANVYYNLAMNDSPSLLNTTTWRL